MSDSFSNYPPPVGFHFTASFLKSNGGGEPEGSFQEVSGISLKMDMQEITEGGENGFTHRVPTRATYENLVLKRGILTKGSALANWCESILSGGPDNRIEPRTIYLALRDPNSAENGALMSWVFENAYPVHWSVNDFHAQEGGIVVEEMSIAYSHFRQVIQADGQSFPNSGE